MESRFAEAWLVDVSDSARKASTRGLALALLTCCGASSAASGRRSGCTARSDSDDRLCVSGAIDGDSAVLTGTASQPGSAGGSAAAVDEPMCEVARDHEPGPVSSSRESIATRRPPSPSPTSPHSGRHRGSSGWSPTVGWSPDSPRTSTRSSGRSSSRARCSVSRRPSASRRSAITGTTATEPAPSARRRGGTWAALGLREFDATPTSHIYVVEGEYTIRLTIDFRAEYRFAGSAFLPIDGTINLRANDLHITVDGAKTVLVEHDCTADPSGPGC